MCPRLSANYVSCCPPNMAQVSVWAGNLQLSPLRPPPAIRVLKTSLILGTTRWKYPTKVRQLAAIQNQERAAMRLQEALITTGGKEL